MAIWLACLGLLGSGINIDSRGETLSALLSDASKQSGLVMEATPQTRDEVVIVSVKDVSPDAFRSHLAAAVGAEWKSANGVWRLGRPPSLERAQQLSERKVQVAGAKAGVQKLRARVAAQPAFGDSAAQGLAKKVRTLMDKYKGHLSDGPGLTDMIALEPESPAGRFSIAAVASLSAEQVADVGPGERIVYSSNPTKVQRPLPKDLSREIRTYVAEQAIYTKALRTVSEGSGWETSWSPLLALSEPSMPSGLIMATARSPYNNGLTVDVMLVGSNGQYVGRVRSLLDLAAPTPPAQPIRAGKVALSPRAQAFYDGLQELVKGKTFIDDPKLIGQMEYPERNDPLSYVAADGVLDLSEGKNVIACLPDEGFVEPTFTCMEEDGKLNLEKFSAWLSGKCAVTEEGGWLVATPLQPIHTRTTRVDRSVVGPFFRNARRSGGASLNDILDVLVKLPDNYMETLTPYLAFFLLPDLNSAIDDRNIELLRVLGRLGPQQRQGVLSGNPIPVGQMNLASHADLNHLIFRADSPISITVSEPPEASGAHAGSIKTEVTFALPTGVPDSAIYTVRGHSSDVVISDGGDTPASNYQPMSAGMLGAMLARGEKADPSDPRQRVNIEKYRYGTTRRYELMLELTSEISMHGQLNENQIPRDKPSLTFDQLPQAFRDAVEKARAETRKQLSGSEGQKVPPP